MLRVQRERQQQILFPGPNPPQSPFRQRNPLIEGATMADERNGEVKIIIPDSSIQSNSHSQHITHKRNDNEQNGDMQSKITTNTPEQKNPGTNYISNTDFN